jgi:small-conductance mechanosensitive channel
MDVDASSRAAVPRVDGVPSALALAAAAEIKRLREALAQRDDTVAALRRQVDAADRRAADAVAASTAAVAAREDAARRAVECQAELQRVVQLYDRLRQASEDALRQRDARVAELELASRSSLAVATEMHDVTRRSLAVSALSQRQAARVHRDTRRMLAESMHAGDRSGDSGGGGGGGVGGSPVVGSPLSQLTRLR